MNLEKLKLQLQNCYDKISQPHPFTSGINHDNVGDLLVDYFAMSLMFPHVQAASHEKIVEAYLMSGDDIPYAVEATSVVAAFLTWDELGGYYTLKMQGPAALPRILETKSFHANLLKTDIKKMMGKELNYHYTSTTRTYMQNLKRALSSPNHIERVAYMVAFEMNAATMIQGLYDSLKRLFGPNAQSLTYFEAHVGGNDPAEIYHIDMTSRLIERLVADHDMVSFLNHFEKACELNSHWCEQIKIKNYALAKESSYAEAYRI